MSYFLKAKKTVGRWLRRTGALSPAPPPVPKPTDAPAANKWSRIHSFIEEIGADSGNAVGRIRLLGFDAFSDRLAAKGPKTLAKVALLAERMIQEEMAKGDRYLDLGDAQFLIFYAHASAEEIKLRGAAIVEAIRQKLFGADEPADPETERHAVDGLGGGRAGHRDQRLRQLFRGEEEVERDEFAPTAQKAIDAIIADAMETQTPDEIGIVDARLKGLSSNLGELGRGLTVRNGTEGSSDASEIEDVHADLKALRAILSSRGSHIEMLEALAKLRTARAEKDALKVADDISQAPPSYLPPQEGFEYVPVLRSVALGGQIYRGIFRVSYRSSETAATAEDIAELDLLLLEHAIYFWTHQAALTAPFMLMVQVHMETLRRPLFQRRYSTVFRNAGRAVKRLIVIEVIGDREGEGSIAVRRAIEELRAHFLAVFVVLPQQELGNIKQWALEYKRAGVHALGIDISAFNEFAALRVFKQLGPKCRQYALSSYVTGIEESGVLTKAVESGIGYICAPGLTVALDVPGGVERTSLAELCGAAA